MHYQLAFRRYRLPFRSALRTAHGVWATREGLIVRLEDEAGRVGYGEAAPIPGFGAETTEQDAAALSGMGRNVDEARLATVPANLGCLKNALAAAIPISVVGQVADLAAISARWPTAPSAYRSIAALLPAGRRALERIPPLADAGFRVFKWKVGVGDADDELALLDDLCAALPSGAKLRLDANGAWDRRRAERWLERCAERPVEFIEQPVAPGMRGAADLLLGLAGDHPTPLALDESLVNDGDIERWIGAGWPGVYIVKPLLLGDLAGTMTRLATARAEVVFSSALETGVGAKEALRVAFAWFGERESVGSTSSPQTGSPQTGSADSARADSSGPPQARSVRADSAYSPGAAAASLLRADSRPARALGFGVWPLFADARFDGPMAAPFLRWEDVERINPEALWTALS